MTKAEQKVMSRARKGNVYFYNAGKKEVPAFKKETTLESVMVDGFETFKEVSKMVQVGTKTVDLVYLHGGSRKVVNRLVALRLLINPRVVGKKFKVA